MEGKPKGACQPRASTDWAIKGAKNPTPNRMGPMRTSISKDSAYFKSDPPASGGGIGSTAHLSGAVRRNFVNRLARKLRILA